MDTGTIVFGWALKLAIGTVVSFFALLFASMIAFVEAKHSALFRAAIVVQTIYQTPHLLLALGRDIPIWSTAAASVSAFALLVPMLVAWAGIDIAKAIYVSILAFILFSVFEVLVSVSA